MKKSNEWGEYMQSTIGRIGYGQIELVSPYSVQTLHSMRIIRQVNDHARLYLTGIVPEEMKDRYIDQATSSDTIQVNQIDEHGSVVQTLFSGLVSNIGIRMVRGIYYLELECVSYTSIMDFQLKTRSFQNKSMPYSELVNIIMEDYPSSDVIDNASGSSRIGQFTIQYRETDWQFLKRIASHFGAVLVPEVTGYAPRLWFGLPEGRLKELSEYHYSVQRTLSEYMETVENYQDDLREEDFTCYTVHTDGPFQIGDQVLFQEMELVVARSISYLDDGSLKYEYTLASELGVRQNPMFNRKIIGAALEGKIIDVTKDTVKIHLDIDASQKSAEAAWIPYASMYTAEGNSGMYCMPEKGESVKLYFPSFNEGEAVAISSVRKGIQDMTQFSDPGVKYWGTSSGKELKLGAKELVLTAKNSDEGHMFIQLQEDEGIVIHSDQEIAFSTEQDLTLEANKLKIHAQEAIYLISGSSSFVLDGVTHASSQRLKVEGLTKAPVSVADLNEPERPEFQQFDQQAEKKKKKSFWGGLLDGVQLALDIVGMIPVVGEVADIANAGISLARGDYAGAALSLAAAIPGVGWAATGAKLATKGKKAYDALKAGGKIAGAAAKAYDAAKAIVTTAKAVIGGVVTKASKALSNLSPMKAIERMKEAMDLAATKSKKLKHGLAIAKEVAVEVAMEATQMVVESINPVAGYAFAMLGNGGGGRRSGGRSTASSRADQEKFWKEYNEGQRMSESRAMESRAHGGGGGSSSNGKPDPKASKSGDEGRGEIPKDKKTKERKPLQPNHKKWIKNGGTIKQNKDGTTTYTNKDGKSVTYNRDGYPDFTPYSHPKVNPVKIEVAYPENRKQDFRRSNEAAGLNKNSDPPVPKMDEPPEGYTWHHHEDGTTMILVEKDIHAEFSHTGGVSTKRNQNHEKQQKEEGDEDD
jgi:hypothetical protein